MKLYTYIAPSRNPALRLAWKSIDPPKIIQIIEARFDYKYIFAETIIEKSCLEIGLEVVELLLHDLHLLKVVGNVLTTKTRENYCTGFSNIGVGFKRTRQRNNEIRFRIFFVNP